MKTKSLTIVAMLLALAAVTAHAQTANGTHKTSATGNAYVDLFTGPDGGTVYPQYTWVVKTKDFKFTGYGFFQRTPNEPLFMNNVNTVSLNSFNKFSVRTETGGSPEKGRYFFQIGPQANIHELVPRVKKIMGYAVVAQLPKLAGLRPPNTLIAAGTKNFNVVRGVNVSADAFYRAFPGGRTDYGEAWLLFGHERLKNVRFGPWLLHDGTHNQIGFGARISLK